MEKWFITVNKINYRFRETQQCERLIEVCKYFLHNTLFSLIYVLFLFKYFGWMTSSRWKAHIVDEVDKITKNKFLSLNITYFCCICLFLLFSVTPNKVNLSETWKERLSRRRSRHQLYSTKVYRFTYSDKVLRFWMQMRENFVYCSKNNAKIPQTYYLITYFMLL